MVTLAIINDDCRIALPKLERRSVQCIVTSPPYWQLRDYDIERDSQIGMEANVGDYVKSLVGVFNKLRPCLKLDGTLWLNIGDTYANKQLLGIPWRVALALQANGWYLRCDVIWSKVGWLPNSNGQRPERTHEYIFMLSKIAKPYYDAHAIRVRATCAGMLKAPNGERRTLSDRANALAKPWRYGEYRQRSSIWRLARGPNYDEEHLAVFPPELPKLCILASSRKGDLVLDPFAGSGTTGAVAISLGRSAMLIEANANYLRLIRRRCKTWHMTKLSDTEWMPDHRKAKLIFSDLC